MICFINSALNIPIHEWDIIIYLINLLNRSKINSQERIEMNEMPEDSNEKKRYMLTRISVGIFRLAAKLKP